MSNSEPSAIVLQGIPCIGGLYISFDSNGEIASLTVRSPFAASKETQKLAKDLMDQAMPADQRRLVPKIALRSKETPCLSHCEAIHACVAGFGLKMPLKLSRY